MLSKNLHAYNLFRTVDLKEKHGLMEIWAAQYSIGELCKQYRWTTISVLQQALDSNKEQYSRGARIVTKLEPTLNGLGNNREVARHFHVMLGLFAPSFFEGVESYHKHTLADFPEHTFRTILILKNREGRPRAWIDAVLLKNTCLFVQLPNPNDPEYEIVKHKILAKLNETDTTTPPTGQVDTTFPPVDDDDVNAF